MKLANLTNESFYKEVENEMITYEYLQMIRDFARHFIPGFCVCGIFSNSMALVLLR